MLDKGATAFLPLKSTTLVPATISQASAPEAQAQDDFLQQKAVYVLCQGLLLAMALYKINAMGVSYESDLISSG